MGSNRAMACQVAAEVTGGVEMIAWMRQGGYEYQYNERGYTGWVRCVGGRHVSGYWPQWNLRTGAQR